MLTYSDKLNDFQGIAWRKGPNQYTFKGTFKGKPIFAAADSAERLQKAVDEMVTT